MKKLIYLASIVFFLGTVSSYAGNISVNNKNLTSLQTDKKKKINEDELPVVIKNQLKGDDYKEWKVDEVYFFEGKDYYQIDLKKGDQTQTLNLDKYGNKVSVIQ
ncbi:MAG TPA: hypothetical protein VHO90_12570 [Bacteroidales bacterium]|nr:hypothetical protein [Bacteroidales bacterium]